VTSVSKFHLATEDMEALRSCHCFCPEERIHPRVGRDHRDDNQFGG